MRTNELEIYKNAIDEVAHVLITDGKGNITYVNDKVCKLTKYNREELIGKNNRIFKSGFHSDDFYKKMYSELYRGNTFKARFKNIAKDGSFFWLDATIIPFMDSKNKPYKFLTIRFDITDKINEMALKEEFLANITHEIRTPLHGILSFIDLLKETHLDLEQKKYLINISEISSHLGGLINDILDIFKLDAGKLHLESIPMNIKKISNTILTLFKEKESNHSVEYLYIEDEKINECLIGDPTRLRQVLYNLIGNSVKFTKAGYIKLQLKLIEETEAHQKIEFLISDTGVGINKEKQEEIFEKFSQSDIKDTRIYGGTGLGLNIVRSLIQLQKGTVSLESIKNKGTNFSVTLTFKKCDQATENELLSTNFIAKDLPNRENYKILIADDEHINRMIFEKQMQKFGFRYLIVKNGIEALDAIKNEHFDLVLMDMLMPEMNGDEALLKIRNEFPSPISSIPIVCVSATVQPKSIQCIIDSGANGHLSKPYKSEELENIIIKILSSTDNSAINTNDDDHSFEDEITLDAINLFAEGDEEFIRELLQYFISSAPDFLEEMKLNFSSNNKDLAGQIHKYRSQISLFGVKKLSDLTIELENKIHEIDDFNPIKPKFDLLIEKSHILINEVAEIFHNLNNK